jgi:hypothetical protein
MDAINYQRMLRREVKMFVEGLETLYMLAEGGYSPVLCLVTEKSDWEGDPPIVWRMNRNMLERFEAREEI